MQSQDLCEFSNKLHFLKREKLRAARNNLVRDFIFALDLKFWIPFVFFFVVE